MYWGLAGSVGTQAKRGIGGIRGHLEVSRGVGSHKEVSGASGV